MDMARHVPLYKALLLLLRSVAACPALVPLLLPTTSSSIYTLLSKLKNYVSSYTTRLASVQSRAAAGMAGGPSADDSGESGEEGVADLSKDICRFAVLSFLFFSLYSTLFVAFVDFLKSTSSSIAFVSLQVFFGSFSIT